MKISVCVTSYNQRNYLCEAIDSVLQQTFRPFEIIVVDDCSNDGSQDVIENYRRANQSLVRTFYQKTTVGIAQNKNFALEQVRGEFVTYLDGDDRFLPTKLQREVKTLVENWEARAVYSNIYYIDSAGNRIGVWAENGLDPPSGYVFQQAFAREFPKESLFRNELVHYESLKKVGFYDLNLIMYEDWDLRIRLTKLFKTIYCPEPLAEYRLHSGGISRMNALRHLQEMRKVYDKNKFLLDDLNQCDRTEINVKLFKIFAQRARRGAKAAFKTGNAKVALKCWLEFFRYSIQTQNFLN